MTEHVEGGAFSEVYRSQLAFTKEQLPGQFSGDRQACTHIYFLLEKGQFSAFHRILSDELWHFYSGDPLSIYEITPAGSVTEHLLGNDPEPGQSHFCMITGGNWFASRVKGDGEYALAGCTVAPGFDFADFEMAQKEDLLKEFPQHSELVNQLCR